jgi:hypothetical protein
VVESLTKIIITTKTPADEVLEKKIALATEGLPTRFCEGVLRDRNRISEQNAVTIPEYIISMKREINPRPSYIRYTIQVLSELSRSIDNEDPLHKWVGSYNTRRIVLIRFLNGYNFLQKVALRRETN